MKKEVIRVFFIFGLILFSGFISASFEIGNLSHSIYNQYGPSDYIKGWINISLENEPANSVFIDSLENSINLVYLLNKTPNFEYSCSTANCISDYSATNGNEEKTFNLDVTESNIVGFKFTGDILSIDSINFTVQSDASSSCYNQLEIDLLDDGTIDKGNDKALNYSTVCSFLRSYGCFDDNEDMTTGIIGETPYCQKVKLSESPGFKIGAWVKDATNLLITIYDTNGNPVEGANCELPDTTSEGEISCDVDFLVTESKDYYVCIYTEEGTGASKIRGYSFLEGCGFQGLPTGSNYENTAYQIFAEGIKFKDIGTLEITNSLPYGNTLGNKVSDYIWKKYGSLDCSNKECIVPIKFISGKTQTITITNLSIKYNLVGFSGAEENNFYDLIEIPAVVNFDFQKLYLNEGNFSVDDEFGNYMFSLSLNDEEIFSEEVIVENVPVIQTLTPLTTASAFPTEFEVIVDSIGEITKYEWDFGNNESKVTTENKVIHTYNSTGQYDLQISVTDSNQMSSYQVFNLIVNSPEELINKTLTENLEDLNNVNTQIQGLELFLQNNVNSILDTEEIGRELSKIQKDYKIASSESDYNEIMMRLLTLKVPKAITTTTSTNAISFYSDKNQIDLNVLQEIGRGYYEENAQDKYFDAIITWNKQNIEVKINYKELSTMYGQVVEPLLRVFELEINAKNDIEDDFYLIINEIENIKFKENYEEKEELGYTYIDLNKIKKPIVFSTTENIGFTDLPMFISPELSKLSIIQDTFLDEDEKMSKWTIFILIILLLVILGFAAYIILQEWYKKKYENHLFKNKNSLYNLITYIKNSKKRGVEDNKIMSALRKSGWNSEQIQYIMKKYSGKRTGMFEIPIDKILNKFKRKKVEQKKPINNNFPSRFSKTINKRYQK